MLVFATGAHLASPEATLEGVREALEPDVLIGCGAGGVLARGREIERGTAVAVWAASFSGEGTGAATVTPFHAVARSDQGTELDGLPDVRGASAVILIPDPYSFPADRALEQTRRGRARRPGPRRHLQRAHARRRRGALRGRRGRR